MGRNIIMVPPNWEHPMKEGWERGQKTKVFQPMNDKNYEDARSEWIDGLIEWEKEGQTALQDCEYWDYNGQPPDKEYYRPWKDEEATWFQLWETVSEGTPVTPPFATKQELADYLAENGDFWDQENKDSPSWMAFDGRPVGVSGWGKERAEKFVFGSGWSPSLMMVGGKIITNPGDMESA